MVRTLAAVLAAGVLQLPPATFAESAVTEFFTRLDSRFVHYQTLFKQPIDDRHSLLLVRAARQPITWFGRDGELAWGANEWLGVFLMDRRDPSRVWDLAILTDHDGRHQGSSLRVERVDASALVLSQREAGYGFPADSLKLFFDLGSKRLLERRDYPPIGATRILRTDDQFCATMTSGKSLSMQTGETRARRVCMEKGRLVDRGEVVLFPAADAETPADLPPLPQSSYDEFAAVRPERVKNGYRRAGTTIEEKVGAWQRIGSRIWFGKTFYDGEGTTGVGDVGYFNTTSRTFTFLKLPELANWSVSALMVEGNDAWVGLVSHPEGADYSDGLLRVDVRNGRTRRYEIRDIIHQVVRWSGALYVATDGGLYVLRDERLTRFRLEPTLNGGLGIVSSDPVNR